MATVSGIKVFKDSIKFPSYIFQVVDYTCPDEPKSTSFHSMIISPSLIYGTGIDFSGGAFTTVYDSDGWANTYYKTVDFGEAEQTVDDVFFSWLDENIVKEPETKTIRTLTINGTVTTEWNGKPVKQVTVDGVTYKMPETYTIEAGTYVGNNTLTEIEFSDEPILFSAGGTNYYGMKMTIGIGGSLQYRLHTGQYAIAYEMAWQSSDYRTLVVDPYVTENETFYNWFTTNFEKQEEPALIAFMISGIDYQAEEGMTWSEWVASSYNSGGYTESDGKIMRLRKFVYTPAGSVDSSDVIVPNESYTEETGGGTAS